MKDRKYLIDTVEEWYCTITQKNVRVATVSHDGTRRCLERGHCEVGKNCKNRYINGE